jgi:hypothetical protein
MIHGKTKCLIAFNVSMIIFDDPCLSSSRTFSGGERNKKDFLKISNGYIQALRARVFRVRPCMNPRMRAQRAHASPGYIVS